MNQEPVIVVGLGAAGSATLLALARRGVACVGIDRFNPPHDRGSSHGLSRLIRLCYYEHPDYVPLLRESYRLWSQLQRESSEPIVRITGGVYIGAPDDPFVAGSRAAAEVHGLDHEVLDLGAMRRRFPQFVLRQGEVGFYEPTTGVLFPEAAISASLDRARALGAMVRTDTRVRSWRQRRGGIEVATDQGTIHGRSLVVCAGPWTAELIPELRSALTVTRQVVAWFEPKEPDRLLSPAMPAWAVGRKDGSVFYGFPMFGERVNGVPLGGIGFKAALHRRGEPTTADAVDRVIRADDTVMLEQFLRDRIPSASGLRTDVRVCLYTNTADGHFVVDRYPMVPPGRVVVVSACSGHGFKLAPVIGRAASDLALDGQTDLPIGFFGWR